MKYNRIFRILGIAVILSLLAVAIPAIPAQAARVIELTPEEGNIGANVISRSGFIGSEIDINVSLVILATCDEARTLDGNRVANVTLFRIKLNNHCCVSWYRRYGYCQQGKNNSYT